ncbi:hypothetical protein IJJ12_01650 [bacterium]|nr:hypothetical protein [bacterium]
MSQTASLDRPLSRAERVRLSYGQAQISVPESIDTTRMSREELVAHVMAGYEDYLAGRVRPADEVFDELLAEMDAKYGYHQA